MAFPFVHDALNYYLGTNLGFSLPMFGLFVALAILVTFWLFGKEVVRMEKVGLIPVPKSGKKKTVARLSELVYDFLLVTVIPGMIGARIFHILEYPKDFFADPGGMIFSTGGFSFIGGLVFGTVTGVYYLKKKGFPILPTADAAAPSMILGYAIGRIGCQISGDGDWGVAANLALKPEWLPSWMWAHLYQGNIAGIEIPPPGVYPTPIYESLAGFLIFFILWGCRKNPFLSGWLFSLYLVLTGLERLLIEQIRVNAVYSIFQFQLTQAEILSFAFLIMGAIGLVKFSKRRA